MRCSLLIMLAVLLFTAVAARADERIVVSPARATFSLNGEWRCAAGDGSGYQARNFNDSSWKKVRLPADLSKAGFPGARVVWCRRSFTPPKGKSFPYLKIEGLTDSGKVWINGARLSIPNMPAAYANTQTGVFGHIWPSVWTGYFDSAGVVAPGAANTVALRIENDPAASDKPYDAHPYPAGRGSFGISGDTFLVSVPDVRIMSIDRTPPGGATAPHRLFLLIGNSGIKTEKITASISVYDEDEPGRSVFSRTADIDVAPSGAITDFSWTARPSFHKYRAVATLRGADSQILDQAALRFGGSVCSMEKGRLIVNGAPFIVRGVHGDFGLVVTGGARPRGEYKIQWMKKDLDLAAGAGANTVHTSHPTPELAAEALKRGMMLIPSLSGQDFAAAVIAMRESPNVLFWEIRDAKNPSAAASAIAALDPYHRPISYFSSKPGAAPDQRFALTAATQPAAGCRKDAAGGARALYYYPWAKAGGKSAPADAAVISAQGRAWEQCVRSGASDGAVYASLAPGLRPPGSLEPNAPAVETLAAVFSELAPEFRISEAGSPVVTLRSHAEYPLNSLKVFDTSHGGKRIAASQSELDPGRNLNVPAAGDASRFSVSYTSHGGLVRGFAFSPGVPAVNPAAFSFDDAEISIGAGGVADISLTVRSTGDTSAQAVVSIKADGGAVVVEPAARNVFLKRGQSVRVPFKLRAVKKAARPALVTAVLEFKSGVFSPLKTFMSATVR